MTRCPDCRGLWRSVTGHTTVERWTEDPQYGGAYRYVRCPGCEGRGYVIHDPDAIGLCRALYDHPWDQARWAALEDRLLELGQDDLVRAAGDARKIAAAGPRHDREETPDGAISLLWMIGGGELQEQWLKKKRKKRGKP